LRAVFGTYVEDPVFRAGSRWRGEGSGS